MDAQRDDVRLAIEERDIDEQPLVLWDTAGLRDAETETDELNEVRGVGDTVPDIEELEEDDGERDADELTLEDAETEEQELTPMVTDEDRDTAAVTDMVRDIREVRVRLSV